MGSREIGAALLSVAAVFFAWKAFGPPPDPAATAALSLEGVPEVPAVDLARLDHFDSAAAPPARDVFKFGRDSRADLSPVPAPVIHLEPRPGAVPFPTLEVAPTPTPWPLLNVSLIGIVDNGEGRQIGSFLKDGEILLVGQSGQVLGNSFRVIRIGTESAEIEELGSGRTRRLPLKTN